MAFIICIETSSDMCSVALALDNNIISDKRSSIPNIHSSGLTVFIDEVISHAGILLKQLDAVAVSKGPGSFTGLRIGVSVAKGICYGLDIPLIAINTLESMVHTVINDKNKPGYLLCPVVDARNNEAYYALYDEKGNELLKTTVGVIDINTFHDYSGKKILFFGDGVDKWITFTDNSPYFIINQEIKTDAIHLVVPAYKHFSYKLFEDITYFEPFYLRDFIPRNSSAKINKVLYNSGK